jgi:hypothetical protein
MKYYSILLISIFCIIICNSLDGFAEEPDSSKPLQWKVGDNWIVRTWNAIGGFSTSGKEKAEIIRKGKPLTVTFKVNRIIYTNDFEIPYRPSSIEERVKYNKSIHPENGYKCFEIQVTYPKDDLGFQSRYLLYFRLDTLNLIRILNNSIRTDGSIVNLKTDYPIDPNGPIFTEDIHSSIPFNWPDWQKKDLRIESKDGLKSRIQQFEKKILSDTDNDSYNGFELTISQRNELDNKDIVRTIQKWKDGYPWWSESIVYDKNGEILYEAELIIPEK